MKGAMIFSGTGLTRHLGRAARSKGDGMNITLSDVKIHPDMSEETVCFSAIILLDGKEIGTVRNSGQGGSHVYYWQDRNAGAEIQKWSNTQNTEFDFEKLDQIIDEKISDFEEKEQLRRWCQRKTLFRLKGDEDDSCVSLRLHSMPRSNCN